MELFKKTLYTLCTGNQNTDCKNFRNKTPLPSYKTSCECGSKVKEETGLNWPVIISTALVSFFLLTGLGYLLWQTRLRPLPEPTPSPLPTASTTPQPSPKLSPLPQPNWTKLPTIQTPNTMTALVLGNNGQTLAGGDEKGNIYIWTVENGKPQKTLVAHKKPVTMIAMSRDQQMLVSGSDDGTIKLWDLQTEKDPLTLPLQQGLTALALSADGTNLVTGGKKINIWNTKTGQLTKTLEKIDKDIESLAISQDASIIVGGYYSGHISFWNKKDNDSFTRRDFTSDNTWEANTVSMSADGKVAISSSCQNRIQVWNSNTWEGSPLEVDSANDICLTAISDDGKTVAGRSSDQTLRLWNLETRKAIFDSSSSDTEKKSDSSDLPRAIALSGDGHTVANSTGKSIQLWRLSP